MEEIYDGYPPAAILVESEGRGAVSVELVVTENFFCSNFTSK